MAPNILPSPRAAMAQLDADALKSVPYARDALPGARDVNTPYGSLRVYEWGPTTGTKVLFIHGLSTPSPALGAVAGRLADRGCRVMLLDLWGRGYSDTPSDLPHDTRLYTTQIVLAIATSPLAWTGSGGFALVGYSMGGGVVVAFAAHFPQLVSSVILIAPGGLYDSLPRGYHSLLVRYPWLFPARYVTRIIRTLLNGPRNPLSQAAVPPVAGRRACEVDVPAIVDWELDHHAGFVYAVTSAIRHAPIERQYATWSRLGHWLSSEGTDGALIDTAPGLEAESGSGPANRLAKSKVLLLVGDSDSILPRDALCRDATRTLGPDNLVIVGFPGDHDFPLTQSRAVADTIGDFWGV